MSESAGSRRWSAATIVLAVVLATILGLVAPSGATATPIPSPSPSPTPTPAPVRPEPRIVGGVKAPPDSWPSQVALLDRQRGSSGRDSQVCGGTVVDRSWVLTAAHCLSYGAEWRPTAGQIDVLVGTQRLDRGGTRIRAAELRIHPGWDPSSLRNDIALVRLDRPVPADVPVQALGTAVDGEWATAVGWGYADDAMTQVPVDLRQVAMAIGSDATCRRYADIFVAATQLCSWDQDRATCAGDSGGPLLVERSGAWVQVGVTSYGARPCSEYPSFFTQVSAFTGWVRQQVRYGPHADAAAFVGATYRDLFGRAPTGTELFSGVAVLDGGQATAEYVAGLLDGTTFRTRAGGVVRLYRATFLRAPDTAGLTYWMGEINRGASLARIAEQMVRVPEFVRRYGGLDEGGFVDLVYRNVLHRVPSATDRAYWIDQMTSGRRTRGQVVVGFSESAEHRRATDVDTRVTGVFWALVRRVPTAAEIGRWSPAPLGEVARALLVSWSYVTRF